MSYALIILWRERSRFLPAMLAVSFSALLIALQCGLLLGLLTVSSSPIDRSDADIWVGSRDTPSIGFGHPIPLAWRARLALQPEIEQTEPYLFGFGNWHKPEGGTQLCYIIGSRLEDGAIGDICDLTPAMRKRLTEPGTVVVDVSDLKNLGLTRGVGEVAEVARQRVRVVGLAHGVKSVGMIPGIFCSLRTARLLLPLLYDQPEQATYLLGRCRDPRDAPRVVRRLREQYPSMTVYTRAEFSWRTRMHWLTKTKAGIHLGFAALLGLFVGAVVTSQTLYSATLAALREYAVLRALGIPRRKMSGLVMAQSFWIGIAGIALALPLILSLERLAAAYNVEMSVPLWLLAVTGLLTLVMALASGLIALRSLRLAEPITLLR